MTQDLHSCRQPSLYTFFIFEAYVHASMPTRNYTLSFSQRWLHTFSINAALVYCYFCVVFVACKVLMVAVVLQAKMQNMPTIKFRRCTRMDGDELLVCLVQAKVG